MKVASDVLEPVLEQNGMESDDSNSSNDSSPYRRSPGIP